MQPIYKNGHVSARCPDCNGAVTTFERRDSSREFGAIIVDGVHRFDGRDYGRVLYIMMRCAGCGRGGLAKIHDIGQVVKGKLEWFFPVSIDRARLPASVPAGVEAEFREAELCASVSA